MFGTKSVSGTTYMIENQCGKRCFIAPDGIFVECESNPQTRKEIKRYPFPKEILLKPEWFSDLNPNKAALSISGNFIYLITENTLYLFTLTSQSLYTDKLDYGPVFVDADFSFEETILYALTDTNKFILFSLIPPKKLQEYYFNWEHKATSFQLGEPQRFFLIKSQNDGKVEKCFFKIPENYINPNPLTDLVLQPIDEAKIGPIFNPNQMPGIHSHQDAVKPPPNQPNDMSELAKMTYERGLILKQIETQLVKRMNNVEKQIREQKQREEILFREFKQIESTMQSLFHRIQQLIEYADNGVDIFRLWNQHKQAKDRIESVNPPETESEGDLLYELKLLYSLYYQICPQVLILQENNE